MSGKKSTTKKLRVYGAIVAAVLLTVILIVNASAIKRQLNDWKLLPQPERLTELYFTNPNNIPNSYTPGQTQTLAFTVHNLEYRTTAYHYMISESDVSGDSSHTLISGSFVLTDNQYRNVAVPATLDDEGPKAELKITLTNQNESIDYLVERGGV